MCALGAQCYATNSMLQTVCGNFQASCSSNQQCAFNTCNGGFCNGLLPSSSMSVPARPSSSTSVVSSPRPAVLSPAAGNETVTKTPTVTPTGVAASRTISPAVFTGAASAVNVAGGALVMLFGGIAWAL
jgi:hypothetical protein